MEFGLYVKNTNYRIYVDYANAVENSDVETAIEPTPIKLWRYLRFSDPIAVS